MLNNSVCPIISKKLYITSSCYIQIMYSRDQIQQFGKYPKSYALAQFVKALRYNPEGRGFDFKWCHWNF